MYGAGRHCISRLFIEARIPCREIHDEHNPLFPGMNPEPIEPHVEGLRRAVMEGKFDSGFATDGDADRIGAIDRTGTFIDSHKIFCILLKHLVEDLELRGEVVRTFSTTKMVDKIAEQTPIAAARHADRLQVRLRVDAHARHFDWRRGKRRYWH